MNKIFLKSIVYVTAVGLLFTACSKKIDDAYLNPNSTVRVPVESLLPGIIGNFIGSSSAAGSSYGTAYDGLYIGRYVQFWGDYLSNYQYDLMGGVTGSSDLLGSVWAMHYYGMGQNLNRMVDWAKEEQKWDYVGVGYAIRAWSWLTVTDQYGAVILKEAYNTSLSSFNYDEQSEVYDTVRAICHRALAYLDRTDGNASQANLALGDAYFYNGDVSKWKKFVYGVLARSFNHLTNKSTYQADSVIYYCDKAMTDNADNATVKFADQGTSGTSNFFGPLRGNVGRMRQSDFIANLLSGANDAFSGVSDPRAWYMIRENNNGTFKGVTLGKGNSGLSTDDRPQNFWGGSYTSTSASNDLNGRYIFRNGVEFPVMTAAEIQFMKAEAAYRSGDKSTALDAYKKGIQLSFDMLTTKYNYNIPAGHEITPADETAFLSNPDVVPADANDLTLTKIMLQKYIALWGYAIQETWVDLRRYHYTDIDPVTGEQVYRDFTPPSPLYVNNNGKYVYRTRPRYNSEYLYDIPALESVGGLDLDYHTKECWFSQN